MQWQSLQDQLEIGMIYGTLYPEAVQNERIINETIDILLEDSYFERVEISRINDQNIKDELIKKFKRSKKKITYAAQPIVFSLGLDINSLDKNLRQFSINELKKSLSEAYEFGADRLTFCSGPMKTTNRQEKLDVLIESLGELSQYACELGLEIHLEIFDYDIHRRRFIGSTRDAVYISEQLGHSSSCFSFLVDLSHIPLIHETIEQAVLPLKDRIGYVHIGNCVLDENDERYGDSHPYFGYHAGENDSDEVCEFLQTLTKIGYLKPGKKAPLTIEIIKGKNEKSEDLIVNAKKTLDKAWEKFIRESK